MERLVGYPVENPKTQNPFFLDASIPFPENEIPPHGQLTLREELSEVWSMAGDDFTKIYNNETHGKGIREALDDRRFDYADVTLEEIGGLVGVNNPAILRHVRSALQIGKLQFKTDIGLWQFTELESVQFMVGLLGKRYRNIYIRNIHNSQRFNPNF